MNAGLLKGIELGTVYRSASAVENCAIMRKPNWRGAYTDRVLRTYVLIYVLDGTGVFTDWYGVEHRVGAGAAMQLPAGRKHSVVHDPDG